MTFKEQDIAVKSSRDVKAMMDQAQYERVEMATSWSQWEEFTRGRDVEYTEEYLVVNVSPCMRALAGIRCMCATWHDLLRWARRRHPYHCL
jgi:hypothetical protein